MPLQFPGWAEDEPDFFGGRDVEFAAQVSRFADQVVFRLNVLRIRFVEPVGLEEIGAELRVQSNLLPNNYTGFVAKNNDYYKPIRDAGLESGKLTPVRK